MSSGRTGPEVIVRRRWNDPCCAGIALPALKDVFIKNDAGGVCRPTSRPFPYVRVWCDQLLDGQRIHLCDPSTAPHELELCIVESDNTPEVNSRLRSLLRR